MYKKYGIMFLLSAIVLISSCYDENNTFGSRQVESVFRNVKVDTNTVVVSLMKIDSVETSGTGVAMAGVYNHPLWGEIEATSFMPFSRPTYNTSIDEIVIFDSLIFQLNPATHFIGDTTLDYTIHLHQLKEKVKLNDRGYLYNTNSFAYEEEPLASRTFRPRPYSKEKITFRLDDELGADFLSRFHNRDDVVSTTRFEDYFKGLVLVSDDRNGCLLTYHLEDTATVMTLHYHLAKSPESPNSFNIAVKKTTQFNHFTHNPSGSILESVEMKNDEILSTELGNRGMLFAGLGWYSKMEFPYINELRRYGEQIEVQSAYLKFYPEQGTYSDFNALPDSIYLYITDENNVATDVVTDYLGNEVQIASLVENKQFPHQTYFYFDISDFISQEMGATGRNKHNLQLVFDSETYTTTFKNLTFGDQNSKNPLTLEITFKIYESY